MPWERVTLQRFTAKEGTLQRESTDSEKSPFFFSFFFSQYLTRMISGVVEKIWLAVQEKGPTDDDMKEQR